MKNYLGNDEWGCRKMKRGEKREGEKEERRENDMGQLKYVRLE